MSLKHPYADFIHEVSKPARYMGGERFAVAKDWSLLQSRMVLAFPDVYDIGMSHQGTKILYSIVNKEEDLCLERAFCPWFDMERELRSRGLPILSLESHRPLSD
ncbi:MAG: B12-binding domain-containing radical SAM protein, partial [Vicinamibacteria bacterium]